MFAKDVAACIVAEKPTLFRRLIVFAGSFDPFALHHREIVEQLVKLKLQSIALRGLLNWE